MTWRLRIVIDNQSTLPELGAEHGLSIWVQNTERPDEGAILLDAGRGEMILRNLDSLGLDAKDISLVFLSHGHYDHAGGIAALVRRRPHLSIDAHPQALRPKWIDDGPGAWRYGGIPMTLHKLPPSQWILHETPRQIAPDAWSTGSIGGMDTLNAKFHVNHGGDLRKDAFVDEQALALQTDKGWIVLTGCCHCGVGKTLQSVKEKLPDASIYALIGGLHMVNGTPQDFALELAAMRAYGIQQVVPLHCSGQEFVRFLEQEAPDILVKASGGSQLEF